MLYSGFNTLPRSVFWSAYLNGRSDNLDVIRLSQIPESFELMTSHNEDRPVLEFLSFVSGWLALGVVGTLGMLASTSFLSFILVSTIGIGCSIFAFRSLEMPFGMAIATILGGMLVPITTFAWIAPWLPGGFMLTVALARLREG